MHGARTTTLLLHKSTRSVPVTRTTWREKNIHFLFVREIKVGTSPNMCNCEEKAASYITENAAHQEPLYNCNFKNYLQSHFEAAAAKQIPKCLRHRLWRMIVISIWRRQYLE